MISIDETDHISWSREVNMMTFLHFYWLLLVIIDTLRVAYDVV